MRPDDYIMTLLAARKQKRPMSELAVLACAAMESSPVFELSHVEELLGKGDEARVTVSRMKSRGELDQVGGRIFGTRLAVEAARELFDGGVE